MSLVSKGLSEDLLKRRSSQGILNSNGWFSGALIEQIFNQQGETLVPQGLGTTMAWPIMKLGSSQLQRFPIGPMTCALGSKRSYTPL